MKAVLLVLGLLTVPMAASAGPRLNVSGYIQPQLQFKYRPAALPRDQWDANIDQSVAGLQLAGEPFARWRYRVLVEVDGAGIAIEEATVSYLIARPFHVSVGQQRIPFTAQHQSVNTELMFPTRSGPNELFLSGTDLGVTGVLRLATSQPDVLRISGGVYNGIDINELDQQANRRGALFALRADYAPLGGFPFAESDLSRGPFRFGVGAGAVYYPYIVFDPSGFESARTQDLRVSASIRAAFRGAFLQAEVLHRQAVDSLSSRPDVTSGAYAQASFFFPLGLEPAARVGYTVEDQSFDPRAILYTEAGFNWYLRPNTRLPNALKMSLLYLGEIRLTERDEAHGGLLQLQLRW